MHLYLQKVADPPDNKTSVNRAWSLTRPDRTQFFFGDQGFQSVIRDKNGNETTFTYEERKSANKPVKFLDYITDAAGRRTLTLDYFEKGQAYSYINDAGVKTAATNLTDPKIIDQVQSITDISGRKVTFTYTDKGLMAELVDGAGARWRRRSSLSTTRRTPTRTPSWSGSPTRAASRPTCPTSRRPPIRRTSGNSRS